MSNSTGSDPEGKNSIDLENDVTLFRQLSSFKKRLISSLEQISNRERAIALVQLYDREYELWSARGCNPGAILTSLDQEGLLNKMLESSLDSGAPLHVDDIVNLFETQSLVYSLNSSPLRAVLCKDLGLPLDEPERPEPAGSDPFNPTV